MIRSISLFLPLQSNYFTSQLSLYEVSSRIKSPNQRQVENPSTMCVIMTRSLHFPFFMPKICLPLTSQVLVSRPWLVFGLKIGYLYLWFNYVGVSLWFGFYPWFSLTVCGSVLLFFASFQYVLLVVTCFSSLQIWVGGSHILSFASPLPPSLHLNHITFQPTNPINKDGTPFNHNPSSTPQTETQPVHPCSVD